MRIFHKNSRENGVALVLALTILSVLVGIAGYFSMNIGMELQGSKGYLNGVKAEALAEAGLAQTIARIKADVRDTEMFNPDVLDKDKAPNPSKFPDLVHKKYSTRAEPGEGVWGDDVDSDSDGETATDIDEMVTVNDKGTPASITDDDGFYVLVRDANARLDINKLTPESKGLLVQFPSIRQESVDSNDIVVPGSIADRIVTGRSALPNGKYTTIDQLRSVLGKDDFASIESEIDHQLTLQSSDVVVSGGLTARYYGLDRSGSTPKIDYNDFKGMAVDHGINSFLEYGENVFAFNGNVDFAFKAETDDQGVDPVLPSFNATQDFAVVWTGYVFIPNTTPITFLISYNGGFRMRVRDVILAETSSHWNPGNSGEVVVTTSLPTGWQPVLIEYYSTGSPSMNIHWDGGYHYLDPGIQKNNASDDPDIDLRTQNTLMPMASFGFKAGGMYEISSTGVVRDKQGKIAAEKTITSTVRIWDYAHESTIQDFSDPAASKSFINFDDACPIHHVGDSRFWSLEYSPTAKTRAYDTMYNAIKLGYWEDFEQIDSTILPGSSNPTYPFYDLTTPKEAWVPRAGASIEFVDSDGDLDKELTFVDASVGSLIADWIGEGASIDAPSPAFAFHDFWIRFEEDDGVGPIDSATYEDQSLAGLGPKDYDGIKHNAGALPGSPDPEDRNANFAIDGPQSWWVGWPFIRMSGIHFNFFTKQEVIPGSPGKSGPGEDFLDANNPATTGHEFETNNGVGSTERVGYTYKKTYLVGVHENNLYFYTSRLSKSGQKDNGFVWLVFRADAIASAFKTFGFSTLGNAFVSLLDGTIGLRKIDNVRVVPLENSKGLFTSRTINAAGAKEWGTVSYTAFHDPVGSHVAVNLGPGGGSPSIPINSGDAIGSALGTSQTVQYSAELSMDILNGGGAAEVNYRQPVFADITITYLVDADTFYYREE